MIVTNSRIKIFYILSLSFIILSCSSDDAPVDSNEETNTVLRSVNIEEKLYGEAKIEYTVTYNTDGDNYVRKIDFGSNKVEFFYDDENNIVEERFKLNGTLNQRTVYKYDSNNRRSKKEVFYNDNTTPDEIGNYTFNSKNQLISTDRETFTYDEDGNLATSQFIGGENVTHYRYDNKFRPDKNLKPINYFFYRTNNSLGGNIVGEEEKNGQGNDVYKQTWEYEYSNENLPIKRTLIISEGSSEIESNTAEYIYN
ncbi:hypothetical protein [Marixanthomonas spongiae]|uniref:YD repeat-containing protein n=1 Tax=Marixanthomonas spongiae TaxID=2174845 RepID=A0A2U0HXC3_9FLAO|nr:hypothetical protein [Marixanthomonas spongiae]PVW13514.1 hypothetical protein DDV96_12705 [Marixanthomonas spongiae]